MSFLSSSALSSSDSALLVGDSFVESRLSFFAFEALVRRGGFLLPLLIPCGAVGCGVL